VLKCSLGFTSESKFRCLNMRYMIQDAGCMQVEHSDIPTAVGDVRDGIKLVTENEK